MIQHSESDIPAPAIFYCDMSRQLMRDPVISVYGYTFERRAIMNWLSVLGNNFCPCSGKDMMIQDLVDAPNLKNEINAWRAEHGLPSDNIIGRTVVVRANMIDDHLGESSSSLSDDATNKSLHQQDSHNHQQNEDVDLEQETRMIPHLDDHRKEEEQCTKVKSIDINCHADRKKGTRMMLPMTFAPIRKLLRVHPNSV